MSALNESSLCNDDDQLLKKLESCDIYVERRNQLSASLSDMYWLLTMAKRKPGGCSVTSAEDMPEEMEATVRVRQALVNGVLVWQLVHDTHMATSEDGLRSRTNCSVERKNLEDSSTQSNIADPSIGLVQGALSPTLRKIVNFSAPAALDHVCNLATAVTSIVNEE